MTCIAGQSTLALTYKFKKEVYVFSETIGTTKYQPMSVQQKTTNLIDHSFTPDTSRPIKSIVIDQSSLFLAGYLYVNKLKQ